MPQLFYEDIYAALAEVVRSTGGMKEVAHAMRPELDSVTAAGWLKDCLNPARREKLDPPQVLWLLKRGHGAGVHDAAAYINQEVGYEPPRAITAEAQFLSVLDEMKALQTQMADSAARVERMAKANPDLLNLRRN